MGHDYDKQKKAVYMGLILLAVITLVEVFVSLLGKGHLIAGLENNRWVIWICALLIIILSIYKAKFIIYEFMHLGHEVPVMAKTILWPCVLLVWAVIAFIWEGNYWRDSRQEIEFKNKMKPHSEDAHGSITIPWDEAKKLG